MLKPHRQIRASGKIGDPSSKFAYNKNLDEVIISKMQIINETIASCETVIDEYLKRPTEYLDGSVMSIEQKWSCLLDAAKKIKEKYDI